MRLVYLQSCPYKKKSAIVIDLVKQLFLVKAWAFSDVDPSYSEAKDRFLKRLCILTESFTAIYSKA